MSDTTARWDALFEGSPASDAATHNHARSRARREQLPESTDKRRDLQGLRMLAVVAVVVNHLTGHPRGGFVGVDVFFVISGFLITSHLVRDLGHTRSHGKPPGVGEYVGGFYRRRIRRLFPAALVVIVATIIASRLVFNPARYTSTWHDGLWAAVFGANWHLVHQNSNYFTAALPESPLQHYWSLSVEEQFYVVWPIALFLLALLVAARHAQSVSRRRLVGAIAASLLCLVSLLYAFGLSTSDPTTAYFSTFTRGWELGLGALLACVVPMLRTTTVIATLMSWLGTTLIVISLLVVHGGVGFPAPGAVLPCLGSVLVISATSPGVRAHNFVLTNNAAVFVGDISYSVYLVHFPVIVLLAAWMGETGTYYYLAAVALMIGLAVGLYALVERPILRSNWLRPSRERADSAAADTPISTRVLALSASATVVAGLAALTLWPGHESTTLHEQQQIAQALRQAERAASSGAATPTPKAEAVQEEIKAALRATSWPRLNPSIDSVISGSAEPPEVTKCGGIKLLPAHQCSWGPPNASHTVEVVGDSTAVAWMPALQAAVAREPGWRLRAAAAFGCQFADRIISEKPVPQVWKSACLAHNQAVVDDVRAIHPDLLVMTNIESATVASIQAELSKVKEAVGKIVILGSMPVSSDPRSCYRKAGSPTDCVSQVPGYNATFVEHNLDMAAAVEGRAIDVTQWFCLGGYCPAFVGQIPTRYDAEHVSSAYSARLGPVVREALQDVGVWD